MREHAAEGPAPEAATDEPIALAPASTAPLGVQGLLRIQRHAGNRAAAALVARQPTATATKLAIGAKGSAVTDLQMTLNQLDERASCSRSARGLRARQVRPRVRLLHAPASSRRAPR